MQFYGKTVMETDGWKYSFHLEVIHKITIDFQKKTSYESFL